MKPARIIILAVAIGSAGMAGILAMQIASTPPQTDGQQVAVTQVASTVDVLVASGNVGVGARLTDNSLRWMPWPEDAVATGYITRANRPNAVEELANAVVRLPLFDGEPVRVEKIADPSSRVMSALLPSGKRAVATEISVATGAGGFILPNDRVDVIMVRKGDGDSLTTETVLSNVRVLAIDQQIEEKAEGGLSVVGTTATLELTPDQTRVISLAQQMAQRLTLALRSVADAQEPDTATPEYLLSGGGEGGVQVIKSGSIVKATSTQQAE